MSRFDRMVKEAEKYGWEYAEAEKFDWPEFLGENKSYELSLQVWSDDHLNAYPLIIETTGIDEPAEELMQMLEMEQDTHDILRRFLFMIAENTDLDYVYTDSVKQSDRQAKSMASMIRNTAFELNVLKNALQNQKC